MCNDNSSDFCEDESYKNDSTPFQIVFGWYKRKINFYFNYYSKYLRHLTFNFEKLIKNCLKNQFNFILI